MFGGRRCGASQEMRGGGKDMAYGVGKTLPKNSGIKKKVSVF